MLAVTIAAALFGVAVRGSCARTELENDASRGRAREVQAQDARGRRRHAEGDELRRSADLVELQVVESRGSADGRRSARRAEHPANGRGLKYRRARIVSSILRGKYADGKSADVSNLNICADKSVDLVN